MEYVEECDRRNCRIEIKDSIVIIICGEVDVDKLRESLQIALEAKSSK
ncbi:MAG: hypothetical protein A4E56_00117 [Pelotomaculum sp. PtaU1.Bin065]|nr:MAG: hypothetical protein A4E56_00117 [Pelotomaculum sp. PtaU1.Bin065]